MAAGGGRLVTVDFEIFGKVQGVFFRKNTRETAEKYHLVGWVQNTARGTVKGSVQGPTQNVNDMKVWLSTVGSRFSRIKEAKFTNEKNIDKLAYLGFNVKRNGP